jgi:hypothetical protein
VLHRTHSGCDTTNHPAARFTANLSLSLPTQRSGCVRCRADVPQEGGELELGEGVEEAVATTTPAVASSTASASTSASSSFDRPTADSPAASRGETKTVYDGTDGEFHYYSDGGSLYVYDTAQEDYVLHQGEDEPDESAGPAKHDTSK